LVIEQAESLGKDIEVLAKIFLKSTNSILFCILFNNKLIALSLSNSPYDLLSKFKETSQIFLEPYKEAEMLEILKKIISESLNKKDYSEIINDDALKFITKCECAKSGSMRNAIKLVRMMCIQCVEQGADRITLENVNKSIKAGDCQFLAVVNPLASRIAYEACQLLKKNGSLIEKKTVFFKFYNKKQLLNRCKNTVAEIYGKDGIEAFEENIQILKDYGIFGFEDGKLKIIVDSEQLKNSLKMKLGMNN